MKEEQPIVTIERTADDTTVTMMCDSLTAHFAHQVVMTNRIAAALDTIRLVLVKRCHWPEPNEINFGIEVSNENAFTAWKGVASLWWKDGDIFNGDYRFVSVSFDAIDDTIRIAHFETQSQRLPDRADVLKIARNTDEGWSRLRARLAEIGERWRSQVEWLRKETLDARRDG